MNWLERQNRRYEDLGCRTFSHKGSSILTACAVVLVAAAWMPSVLSDVQVHGYISSTDLTSITNVQTDEPTSVMHRMPRYHIGIENPELEQAVIRAAQQYHVQPALLLAVIKAESSFNPIVVSKAGAVGLMQLIPETAIRHGVRNLYDTNDNVNGGAKHLRYLLDRFHGNIRLALAAYNAGERKVDRYGQIPPYKETQDYVKKVLTYYRGYKKDGWNMLFVTSATSLHVGRPY